MWLLWQSALPTEPPIAPWCRFLLETFSCNYQIDNLSYCAVIKLKPGIYCTSFWNFVVPPAHTVWVSHPQCDAKGHDWGPHTVRSDCQPRPKSSQCMCKSGPWAPMDHPGSGQLSIKICLKAHRQVCLLATILTKAEVSRTILCWTSDLVGSPYTSHIVAFLMMFQSFGKVNLNWFPDR